MSRYPTETTYAPDIPQLAAGFVEGTPEGHALLMAIYPPHLYDRFRQSMAAHLVGKEIAKLVGIEGNAALEDIRGRVQDMAVADSILLPPVREFWTMFDMITRAKTKRVARFVTAANVEWSQEDLDLDTLTLTWMPFVEKRPEVFGPKPWPIGRLRESFAAHPDVQAEAQLSNKENLTQYTFQHREEPLIVVDSSRGREMIDGNGRLYGALMDGKEQAACWVGVIEGEQPQDFWVSAGTLKDLCCDIVDAPDAVIREAGLTLLRHQLTTNRTAYINYHLWLRKDFPQVDAALW